MESVAVTAFQVYKGERLVMKCFVTEFGLDKMDNIQSSLSFCIDLTTLDLHVMTFPLWIEFIT